MKKFFLLLTVFVFFVSVLYAQSAAEKPVLLSSENWAKDSAAAASINAYIAAVTDEKSESFIPETDRVAVFDLDGTIIVEDAPFCFEYMFFADYVLNNPDARVTPEVKAVAQKILDASWGEKPSGMSTEQAAAGAVAYRGLSMSAFAELVNTFKQTPISGFSGLTWSNCGYRPMVELVGVLKANGFDVYIVTATERNIVRSLVGDMLSIEPDRVIGTEYGYTATSQNGVADSSYTFRPGDEVVFDGSYSGENANMCKVDAIVREIGRQPVLAFGNSSGDLAMCIYTVTGNRYPSKAFMVIADDEEREYGNTAKAEKNAEDYRARGLEIISTRDDFGLLFGDGVRKTPVR